jgi:hypothetical protein
VKKGKGGGGGDRRFMSCREEGKNDTNASFLFTLLRYEGQGRMRKDARVPTVRKQKLQKFMVRLRSSVYLIVLP